MSNDPEHAFCFKPSRSKSLCEDRKCMKSISYRHQDQFKFQSFPLRHERPQEFRSLEMIHSSKYVWSCVSQKLCELLYVTSDSPDIVNYRIKINSESGGQQTAHQHFGCLSNLNWCSVPCVKSLVYPIYLCMTNLTPQTKYNLPSWCDRVLRRSYPLVHVVCQAYGE